MTSQRSLRNPSLSVAVLLLALALPSGPAFAASQDAGIPRFYQVNEQIYRGGQATDEGFRSLAKLGIKTIIDLRESGERAGSEKKVVEAAGMRYVNVPMQGMHRPSDEQISQVLAILNDSSAGPVFVHCRRGADRTGTVIAVYRVAHDRWQNQKALEEARAIGMSWIEFSMQSYILGYRPSAQNQANVGAQATTAAPRAAVSGPGLAGN